MANGDNANVTLAMIRSGAAYLQKDTVTVMALLMKWGYRMKRMMITCVMICFLYFCGCGKIMDDSAPVSQKEEHETVETSFAAESTVMQDQKASEEENLADEEAVILCRGVINGEVYGKTYDYQIQMINEKPHDWKMKFTLWNQEKLVQELETKIEFNIDPCSISAPVTMADVNEDGFWDFIIDYGILGKASKAECIIWNSEAKLYEVLDGYSGLCNVIFDKRTRTVYESYDGEGARKITNQYVVQGDQLELIATMIADWTSGQARYTEKRIIDGELVVTQDNLPESKTSFDGWLYY